MENIDKLFFLGSGTLNIWRSARYKDYNIEEFYAAVDMDELCGNPVKVTSQKIVKKAGTTKCKKCENHLKQFIVPPTFSKLDKNSTNTISLDTIIRENPCDPRHPCSIQTKLENHRKI